MISELSGESLIKMLIIFSELLFFFFFNSTLQLLTTNIPTSLVCYAIDNLIMHYAFLFGYSMYITV